MYDDGDEKKKATIASITAGVMFGLAWWIYIDGAAVSSHEDNEVGKGAVGYSWLPGVGCTIAFVMINGMKWSQLTDDMNQRGACMARGFLIGAMMLGLGCIAAGLYIMVEVFLNDSNAIAWTGISIMIQCLLIFMSTFIMRFGTIQDDGM